MLNKMTLNDRQNYLNEKLQDAIIIFINGYGESRLRLREACGQGKLIELASVLESGEEFTGINANYLNNYMERLRKDLSKYGSIFETVGRVQNKAASRIMETIYSFYFSLSERIDLELKEK